MALGTLQTIFADSAQAGQPEADSYQPQPTVEVEASPAAQPEAPQEPSEESPDEIPEEFEEVPEADDEFDDTGFTFEDLSEDEEALAAELSAGAKNAEGNVGEIHGIVESTDGSPLIGAYISLEGTDYLARTGADGSYSLSVPPGVHSFEIRYDGFETKAVSQFEIAAGDSQTLNARLAPLAGAALTLVVEGEIAKEGAAGRLIERKQATEVRDIMSREEIKKSGGSSAGSVAKRMVATTIIGGRYVFVRGLGHRYGNTLFDGARVPSPDPDLRTVPLDIFPTAALSAINVQKTFSPDVPGDFAGASVQLESRSIPDEAFFSASASLGANTYTTFREMVTGHGFAGPDAFGYGNLKRALPENLPTNAPLNRSTIDPNTFLPIWDAPTLEKWGERLYTHTELIEDERAPMNFGADLAYGQGWDIGENSRIGTIMAAGYSNAHSTKKELVRVFSIATEESGEVRLVTDTPQVDLESFETTQSVAWNALGQVGLELDEDHEIDALAMYSRDAEDETRVLDGVARSVSGEAPVRSTRMRYVMRSLFLSRLGSKHDFGKMKLDWFASLSQARRSDPALREMLYTQSDPAKDFRLDTQATAAKQLYMDLVDDTRSGALNLEFPFKQWGGLDGRVKIGGWAEDKEREFVVRRFAYKVATGLENLVPTKFGEILDKDTIGGGVGESQGSTQPFYIEELTRSLDNYRGRHSIFSGYAKLDLPLAHWLKVSGGARLEASYIDVEPYDIFAVEADDSAETSEGTATEVIDRSATVDDIDVLPALSLTFNLSDSMKLRMAGTRTLARPELRELAPFIFTDFVGGFDVMGNPRLQSSKIWNADLRWEWFPSAGEVVAATLFYKHFDKPIEAVVAARPGQGLSSFRNAKQAQNIGVELELRKNFAFIKPALEQLSIGANYAYIHSRVELAEPVECETQDEVCALEKSFDASTSRKRPLQGQAPHVLNAYIDLELKKSGTGLRVLYNMVGRKIHRVSGLGAPDIYEEAIHGLDFRATQVLWPPRSRSEEIDRKLSLSLSATNLLDYATEHTQGEDRAQTYELRKGQTFSLSLSWSM